LLKEHRIDVVVNLISAKYPSLHREHLDCRDFDIADKSTIEIDKSVQQITEVIQENIELKKRVLVHCFMVKLLGNLKGAHRGHRLSDQIPEHGVRPSVRLRPSTQ
jgi:hypothetical protein